MNLNKTYHVEDDVHCMVIPANNIIRLRFAELVRFPCKNQPESGTTLSSTYCCHSSGVLLSVASNNISTEVLESVGHIL